MRSYEKIEDFLEDKSFKKWVLEDDAVHKAQWLEWLAAHPSHVELLEHAKIVLMELRASEEKWAVGRQEKLILKILGQINQKNGEMATRRYHVYTSYASIIEKRVRAVTIVLLALGLIAAVVRGFLSETTERAPAVENRQEEWIIKTNPKGQKSMIQLADGSKVILNAESEIRYGNEFGQAHRDIYLKGEAFFEVASDSLLPFRILSGDLVTTAMGTSFNIKAYEEQNVRVQLATGKVKVYKEAQESNSVYLFPGEEVTVSLDDQLSKSKFDLNNAFHWKNGVLLFKGTPFHEAVVYLERWYAVDVTLNNLPPSDMRVSGEFKNTYLKDVLESLSYAYGFDFSIKNKKVIIQFKTH